MMVMHVAPTEEIDKESSWEGWQRLGRIWRQLAVFIPLINTNLQMEGQLGILVGIITTKGSRSADLTLCLPVLLPFLMQVFPLS